MFGVIRDHELQELPARRNSKFAFAGFPRCVICDQKYSRTGWTKAPVFDINIIPFRQIRRICARIGYHWLTALRVKYGNHERGL